VTVRTLTSNAPTERYSSEPMSPFQLTTSDAVRRIRAREKTIHAYVTTRTDEALMEAEARASETPRSLLHGVPYGLKDEWDTAGIATTGGSHRHRDRVPEVDSDVARVFREAGAVLVGKTNLSDLGLSPEASSWVGGSTRNPHDLRRTAGGSSGGAAAAIADGMQAFDWGTDIGGSIRLPAAFCGIYGLRLSSETWPITSLFPNLPRSLASMCGQGPMTTTLPQMKAVLDVARPVIRTGPARKFSLRGAYLHSPVMLGEWPSFAEDVQPVLARAVEGPVIPRAPLPDTEETFRVNVSLWASHLDELLEADPTIEFAEGVVAVLSSLLLRGRFGDRRFHPRTAELLLLILLGRYTLYTNSARETARPDGEGLVQRGLRSRLHRGEPGGLVPRADRRPHQLQQTDHREHRARQHRRRDRARDPVRAIRQRSAPRDPAPRSGGQRVGAHRDRRAARARVTCAARGVSPPRVDVSIYGS
jgi:hypothetical protein